jgi:hypothetical protein
LNNGERARAAPLIAEAEHSKTTEIRHEKGPQRRFRQRA